MNNNLRRSIQKILLTTGIAVFSATTTAQAGQQNPPPSAGHIPDYFGITGNYANSPFPVLALVSGGTGTGAASTTYDYVNDGPTKDLMDIQGGSGYLNGDVLTITTGGATPTSCTAIVNNASPIVSNVGGGIMPNLNPDGSFLSSGVTINSTCAGIFTTPVAGTGIRKFVDTLAPLGLPGVAANNLGGVIPIAVPDTTTFPGSDYYELAESEYQHQFHSDLPSTTLRGYKQLNAPAGSAALDNHYLSPIIVGQKGRPVRVKFVNQLPTGVAGKLPLPVDTTYMGADGINDTDNRAAVHLHGGNTPWISDGTVRQWVKPKGETGNNKGESVRNVPDMWFNATGAVISSCAGQTTCTIAGASNNPGDGAMTFFFTNDQSARLMFYHDHAEGTTRLNVYNGTLGVYLLQDPTEKALVDNGTLPSLVNTIPLVIQEKTFVPDRNPAHPVLNFYGSFRSQLESQDPTWRWGTGKTASAYNGNGDLWVPHIFMPNQNPGDVTGANAVGRWDYGPWFWPPFTAIQNGPIVNPYYDAACNTTTSYCEGQYIPGVPNGSLKAVLSNGIAGGVMDHSTGKITESPSGTPESFNDTSTVNGTAYPTMTVDPKPYRFRILSVGNDRMLNLSLLVAASKNSADTAAQGNIGLTNSTILCDGKTAVDPADCTEAKMVPWDAVQNKVKPFPTHWYSTAKGGVIFDGRPAGVFDPATRGPAMVQIGTDGGFLSSPVIIPNQPVNYEYNPKNILIGNVKEHALLLGPAERADVLVDFTNFAGSTLLLYNDSPAPMPAWDLRLDYYTGDFDNTDTGGAFSVVPGYGPNSRTLMQIRVTGSGGTNPVDDTGTINMATLTTAVQTAFKTSQEPIIVPQSVYGATYGTNFTDALGADLSRISDSSLTYTPLDPTTKLLATTGPVKLAMGPKSIIEDWTQNWGRMNALLGLEIPHTNAATQTSLPFAFVDAPTEIVKITKTDSMVPISGTAEDGTQIWKITHNGVDSHAIHFHLFHVQLVNRAGWDGAIYPPDANELGWKDTVRMNPLSDTIVALRPMRMSNLTFKVPNSHRLLMPNQPQGAPLSMDQFGLDPMLGNLSDVTNQSVNYGWEYLWHCHILGHEENDMMRPIAVAKSPDDPINLTATKTGSSRTTKYVLNWTDNSIIANWVTIQRSTNPTFSDPALITTINVLTAECTSQAGCARTYTDSDTAIRTGIWYYRVQSNNTVGAGDGIMDTPALADGSYGAFLPAALSPLTPGFTGYGNATANSNWTRQVLPNPVVTVSPSTLSFDNVTTGTNATKIVTLTNIGTGPLAIASATVTGTGFTKVAGGCGTTLAGGASCNISVKFAPTTVVAYTGSLVITDNSEGVTGSKQTVALTGAGIAPIPVASVSTAALSFGDVMLGATANKVVTLNNTGTGPLTIASATVTGTGFTRVAGGCGATLAAGANCAITVQAAPTTLGAKTGSLVITDNTGAVANSTQTVSLSANGIPLVMTANDDTATNSSNLLNSLIAQSITVNVLANDIPANNGTVTIVGAVVKTAIPGKVAPTATAAVAVVNNQVVLTLTANGTLLSAARTASKVGVYTVTYNVTIGGTTSQAKATITVN